MVDKKIKVLHIIGALNLGGAETMVVNIMRNIDREKFQFDFYLSGNGNGYYEGEVKKLGARIYNIGRRKKNPIKYCLSLYKLIIKEKYDVVQIHATDAQDGLPAMIAKLAGTKKVCLFSHSTGGFNKELQKIMTRFFIHFIDYKQACSDKAAKWMYGKYANQVKIIPIPVNTELCKFNDMIRKEKRIKYKIKETEVVIGHIGRYFPPKNHMFLLNVFQELIKINEKYRLVLIGGGILEDEIHFEIEKRNLKNKIIELGQVTNACNILSMFDIFLLPSFYEGFPTVLLEAQANGLQCIASDTITSSIAITDLISFYSLKKTAKEWASFIHNHIKKRKDDRIYNKIIFEMYDVKKVANIFAQIYSS